MGRFTVRAFVHAISIFVFVSLLIGASPQTAKAAGAIRYAKPSGRTTGDCLSWATACSLPRALQVALAGDQIWAARGTYKPTTVIVPGDDRSKSFRLKNRVAVYGGFRGTETSISQRNFNANRTTLSGEIGVTGTWDDAYHVVLAQPGTTRATILDGFTIQGGNATGTSPHNAGGGIYTSNSSPTLQNLIIQGNYADIGGGLYNFAGSPVLRNVKFNQNSAASGGGMHSEGFLGTDSRPSLTKCYFTGNTALSTGGGMDASLSNVSLTKVVFSQNQATGLSGNAYGAALFLHEGSPTLTDVEFSANSSPETATSSYGGAIYNDLSNPTLRRVRFTGNVSARGGGIAQFGGGITATDVGFMSNSGRVSGGSIYAETGSASITNALFSLNTSPDGGAVHNYGANYTVTNATFVDNSATSGGGAVLTTGILTLYNVTFANNSATAGGAIQTNGGSVEAYNSIFWDAPSTEMSISGITPTIYRSLMNGGCPGTAYCSVPPITQDPMLQPLHNNGGFVATMALGTGSAAIDTGDSSTCPLKDQRGVSRPQGLRCDIGAYEIKAKIFTSIRKYDGDVEGNPATGRGIAVRPAGDSIRIGDNQANHQYRGILSFDTSALPDSAHIVSARVRMRYQSKSNDPFGTLGVIQIGLKRPFIGTGIAMSSSDFQASIPYAGSFGVDYDSALYFYAFLAYGGGLAEINKTGTTQARLSFMSQTDNDGLADILAVYSGEASIAAYRPVLVVYYGP